MCNLPDTSHTDRFIQVAGQYLLAQLVTHKHSVLDNASIHIDDVKSTVRPHFHVYGTEALIRRGHELPLPPGLIRIKNVFGGGG